MESDVVVPALKRTKSEGRAKKKRQKGPKKPFYRKKLR